MKAIVKEYIGTNGKSPFADWFDGLNSQTAA